MKAEDGYYGATTGEIHITTGASGFVGVQLRQGLQEHLNLAQMYRSGLTIPRIVLRTGLSSATIWKHLRREGVPIRARGHRGNGVCLEPDCGRKCGMARRCKLHAKMRNAELNLEAARTYKEKKRKRRKPR